MTMIMTIDNMASRYSILPSKILSEASTWDLFIMDAAQTYTNYLNEKDNPGYIPPVTDEELLKIHSNI